MLGEDPNDKEQDEWQRFLRRRAGRKAAARAVEARTQILATEGA